IIKKGYHFESMNRMDGALEYIEKIQPDLILLDLHLPDGSGLHLCEDLQKSKRLHDIPIFILTTREFSIERDMALEAGVTAFIQKPLDLKLFLDQIEEVFSPTIDLKFWGIRGSTPCANRDNMIYGGNTSCVQVIIPEAKELLILDSGSGIRNLGNDIVSKKDVINGRIFITHAHWDHIQGFPFFKPIYSPDNKFSIHMPRQARSVSSEEVLSGQMTFTYFPVTTEMLQAKLTYHNQKPGLQDYGDYQVEFMLSNHPVATAIYKIHCRGKVIVYCPDNELVPDEYGDSIAFKGHLREFIKNVDVVIHDGQYDRMNYPSRRNWGHSAWEDAVDICCESGVKNLFITHHDPDSTDKVLAALDRKLQEHAGSFHSIQAAREGDVFKMKVHAGEPMQT
ncbi:MAG: response regulator, partial [Balneolales bacterium]